MPAARGARRAAFASWPSPPSPPLPATPPSPRPCAARLDDAPARHWALPATDAPRGGVGRPLASRMAKAMHLRPAFACASLARIAGAARSSLSHGVAPSRRSSGPPPRPHDFGSASAEPAYPPSAARLRRNAIARVVRRAARCAARAPAPAPAAVPPAAPARRQPAAISTEHAQRTTAAHASVRRGVAAHARHVRRATPPSRASSPSPSARTSPCIRRAPLLS
ncbi:Uncharacterised protein [Burkholderia pseudomallei]|nr:Uncharacterised protein [Burkholderia pseudomallei]CAK1294857.1 Uncharacterised protein [Burkholderia pseudomallei]CAK1295249.1 Uncharacterised protein [Burkholderia pseudomallei]CAK1296496.1 Uncharacterised protein [Burkholderia pseudomallei]CAK1304558.1 Uncharacterised protein [Burkholderia pseudomallei]